MVVLLFTGDVKYCICMSHLMVSVLNFSVKIGLLEEFAVKVGFLNQSKGVF